MKLLRYGPRGQERPGLVDAEGIIRDLSSHVDDIGPESLAGTLLERLAALDPSTLAAVDPDMRIGPCLSRTGNFLAIGLNFADHAAESGMPVPDEPIVFSKAPNCLAGPFDDLTLPPTATRLDWEVELAVVIGRPAYRISAGQAEAHIAGYCICNDISERAWQLQGTGQWLKGKSAPGFGPIGPYLVTRDEIDDPQALDMYLHVNDECMQKGSTRTMIFPVRELVAYLSGFMRLEPGDIIATGTPPGVGMGKSPPRYLKPGDRMRLGIAGLGEQEQRVVAAP